MNIEIIIVKLLRLFTMMKHYNQNYHEVDYKLLFYFLLASLLLISLGVGN